jgi:8-oxo-dGTP pyrophosphatase MutT (NUDIX family)
MVKKYQPYANGQNDLRRGVEFIGVSCAFICHDGKGRILDFGGGSHEFGATLVQTVKREIKEEYGVKAADLKFIKVYDAHRQLADGTPTHWVVALFAAKVDPAKVKNNEPYKIDEIGWFKPDQLPESMHSQAAHNIKSAILIKAI